MLIQIQTQKQNSNEILQEIHKRPTYIMDGVRERLCVPSFDDCCTCLFVCFSASFMHCMAIWWPMGTKRAPGGAND